MKPATRFQFGIAAAITVLLSPVVGQTARIELRFDTLPSQQGWQYWGNVPESAVFSIVGGVLRMDGRGLGDTFARYDKADVVDVSLPFSIETSLRIIDSDNQIGDTVFTLGAIGAGLDSELNWGRIEGADESQVATYVMDSPTSAHGVFSIVDTNFHDYRLDVVPGGSFQASIDGVVFAQGLTPTWNLLNHLYFQDGARESEVLMEMRKFIFTQGTPVTSAPVVTTQPQNRTNLTGTLATFRVTASGTEPLSYQWRRDNTNLSNGGNVSGATTATLTLSNVTTNDAAGYTVLVTNVAGSVTSSPLAVLKVVVPLATNTPSVFTQPAREVGADSAILCGMVVPNGAPTLAWFEWGSFGSTTNITASVAVGSGSTVVWVTYSLVGLNAFTPYTCRLVASNALGQTTAGARYFVTGGSVTAWGNNTYGQATVPNGLGDVVAVAGGEFHSLVLTRDRKVLAWGRNDYGQTDIPLGLTNANTIAGGGLHSLALLANGTVAAWGAGTTTSGSYPHYGQSRVPDGLSNCIAIAAGSEHSLALTRDGRVVAWGNPVAGRIAVPTDLSNVVAIAAGLYHSLALRCDGSIVAWGEVGIFPNPGAANVPVSAGNVVAIAAGQTHSLALRSDGTVVAWGDNSNGQLNTPPGLDSLVSIAAGQTHNLGIRVGGDVVAWSWNGYGATNSPSVLPYAVTVASSGWHSLALHAFWAPLITIQPESQTNIAGTTATFSVTATGGTPLSYQWRFEGTAVIGATNSNYVLPSVNVTDAGAYDVVASNAHGSVTSAVATLVVRIIREGDEWRYNDLGVDLGAFWRERSYDDSLWADGHGIFESGIETSENTPLRAGVRTCYFRKKVFIPVGLPPVLVRVHHWVADGIVLYLNGRELLRTGMSSGAVVFETSANRVRPLPTMEGPYEVPVDGFLPGTDNWICAEIHQGESDAAQTVFDLTLDVMQTGLTPPVMAVNPGDRLVLAGGTATFDVEVHGAPPMSIQWWRLGFGPIDGASFSKLTLTNVTLNDSGYYYAVATNPAGSTHSALALMSVIEAAPILRQPVFDLGTFGFEFSAIQGVSYRVETSTNLVNWRTLLETNVSSDTFQFTDAEVGAQSRRFYRVRF